MSPRPPQPPKPQPPSKPAREPRAPQHPQPSRPDPSYPPPNKPPRAGTEWGAPAGPGYPAPAPSGPGRIQTAAAPEAIRAAEATQSTERRFGLGRLAAQPAVAHSVAAAPPAGFPAAGRAVTPISPPGDSPLPVALVPQPGPAGSDSTLGGAAVLDRRLAWIDFLTGQRVEGCAGLLPPGVPVEGLGRRAGALALVGAR